MLTLSAQLALALTLDGNLCVVGGYENRSSTPALALGKPDRLDGHVGLAERIIKEPCAGFAPGTMAAALAAMLHWTLPPPANRSVWRLRFNIAKLH